MNAIMCKKGLEHPRPHNDHSFDSVTSVIDLGNLGIRPKSSQTAKSTEAYNSLKPFQHQINTIFATKAHCTYSTVFTFYSFLHGFCNFGVISYSLKTVD